MSLIINKDRLMVFAAMLVYVSTIALGAEKYLPYQSYAPGIFRGYTYTLFSCLGLVAVAIFCSYIAPAVLRVPSDLFLFVFNILLLAPTLALGIGVNSLGVEQKAILFLALTFSFLIIRLAGRFGRGGEFFYCGSGMRKSTVYAVLFAWLVIYLALLVKYHSVMRFSSASLIYEQRELTSDVGGLWGYMQLYSTYVFSTLLMAHGLSSNRWRYFIIGSFGYFFMFLVTAEKAHLMSPVFFMTVYYIVGKNIKLTNAASAFLLCASVTMLGVVFLGDIIAFFDLAGFYIFARIIAVPGQFILDYYEFFSSNGYTFFSQIRGFDLFVDVPAVYSSNPKWPQLGWIVGAGFHGIESNSNATFLASDGLASMGGGGMLIMSFVIFVYLVVLNFLTRRGARVFWAIIFAQQAFMLVSGSLFSLMLSFGGFFYLLFFFSSSFFVRSKVVA